jgi:predicted dehydrogenase
MTKELGVGIIGCGNISTTYFSLAPLFRGLKVLACADINAQAAEARAKEYGVKAQTIDELLVNDEIDVVVNLTIPDAHFRVSKAILEAGKHVYSEKPLVLSLEEGEELRHIAKQKNLAVGCAPDTFLGGAHQVLGALVAVAQHKGMRRRLRRACDQRFDVECTNPGYETSAKDLKMNE